MSKENTSLKRELGLISAIAIVVGNIIGSGVFLAPTSLALVSNPKTAILAWIITGLGSLCIALSFANLGSAIPKTGGPVVYTKEAFGDFAGFLVAWTFWIGAWVGNAAVITGFMSYLSYFIPVLGSNKLLAFIISSSILWILVFINIKGAKEAGLFSIITTILKIIPLLVFVIIAGMHFDIKNLSTISRHSVEGIKTLPAGIAIALWAFLGIESAAISGGEIKNPEKTIKQSTIYGTLIAALVYILISVTAMGAVSQNIIAKSNAPLADIINITTGGKWGGNFIAIGAMISTLGAMSGGILVAARCAFAAGEDKIFPQVFCNVHSKFRTPHTALIINGVLTNLLLITNYVQSLTSAFNFMILLATLAVLPSYTFTAASEMLLLCKKSNAFNIMNFVKNSFIGLLAFAYSVYAIYGTGAQVVMYGFILMLVGIPFYVYIKIKNKEERDYTTELKKVI